MPALQDSSPCTPPEGLKLLGGLGGCWGFAAEICFYPTVLLLQQNSTFQF